MTAKAKRGVACLLAIVSMGGFALGEETGSRGIPAQIRPSKDVVISFARPGRVVEINVKEGDEVKKGELLARQDDSEESALVDLYKSKAEDNTQIEAQKLIQQQSARDYQNLKKAGPAASTYERDHAELQAQVDQAKIAIATEDHLQNGYQYEQYKAAEEKTKLYSPIDGYVEELKVHQGESVDNQNMQVMRLVKIDPLWVEAMVPFAQASKLKVGDEGQVKLSDGTVKTAHVIHVALVADSASGTLKVRLELPNPEHRKAGEGGATVSFPSAPPIASAAGQQ